MAASLEQAGFSIVDDSEAPDAILVHTCCVTEKAEGKSRRAVNRLADLHPKALMIITGCLAEINPHVFSDIAHRSLILGAFEKDTISERLHSDLSPAVLRRGSRHCCAFFDIGASQIRGRSRNFLKIQDGCSQGCTYCIVPGARGSSRSLAHEKVIEHAGSILAAGCAEIVLTGIHIGHYGKDFDPPLNFDGLVSELVSTYPYGLFRISSIEPQEITDQLIELIETSDNLCPHLHVPLQSGDNAILQKMGRPYDSDYVLRTVRKLRKHIPHICLGLDVLVGFPGEDENSYTTTLQLIDAIQPAYLHVFPFSPRPGTPAASMPRQVRAQIKKERVDYLRRRSDSLKADYISRFIGKILAAVPEINAAHGERELILRTTNYISVRVRMGSGKNPQELGRCRVKVEKFENGKVRGSLI